MKTPLGWWYHINHKWERGEKNPVEIPLLLSRNGVLCDVAGTDETDDQTRVGIIHLREACAICLELQFR